MTARSRSASTPLGPAALVAAGAAFTVTIDETGATHAARLERLNARIDAASQTIELIARFTEARPAGPYWLA